MSLTKVTSGGITDSAVTENKLGTGAVTENKIGANAVTTGKISDGAVSADDLASTLDLSSKTVTLPAGATSTLDQNIALLGFKMAVNDGLTIFNLVDGVVDEFNDESGIDESEGSNDNYNSTDDHYSNQGTASAGFSTTAITEPDTSSAGTNPGTGVSTSGSFTVPSGMTTATMYLLGAGGGKGPSTSGFGGGGGFVSGDLAVTPGQVLHVQVGEGGAQQYGGSYGGGHGGVARGGGGGGATFISSNPYDATSQTSDPGQVINEGPGGASDFPGAQTDSYLVAGAGAGSGGDGNHGGPGGGLIGDAGGRGEQTSTYNGPGIQGVGGGGDQEQGGQGGNIPGGQAGTPGSILRGGGAGGVDAGGGGAGYYGGGGGAEHPNPGAIPDMGGGGGGSSYYGNPQITNGATEEGTFNPTAAGESGAVAHPTYPTYSPISTGDGGDGSPQLGSDGYVLITGSAGSISSTVVSTTFTATSEPSTARIVVFQENIDTPTLNTDVIASVSRDGTNFSNATLTDSGYVTGSSGQRILTGTVDVSGQPTGTSMRWKLALANNAVKIHGVSLQWK